MTPFTSDDGIPGRLLLYIARLLFDQSVLAAVVLPTIADMQQEVRAAGRSRTRRLLARGRGYRAFWILVALSPFAFHRWPARRDTAVISPGMSAGVLVALAVTILIAATSPSLGSWAFVVAIGGSLFAIGIHLWHNRHPSEVAIPDDDLPRRPEINFSSTPVGGNMGGLIFAVGSVVVLAVGLPMLRWYFLAALASGLLTGALLFAWRQRHPSQAISENRIAG
jgi:hypothetical protein